MEAKSVRINKELAERTEDGRLKASCTIAEEGKEVVSNRTELSPAAPGGGSRSYRPAFRYGA